MRKCRHLALVQLPDGTQVQAASFDRSLPYERDTMPNFGVYLDPAWAPPWPCRHVAWPDFGVPADTEDLRDALECLLAKARDGQLVEVGCIGGHGRTGTALACVAILAGVPAHVATDWVRESYCPEAVEGQAQTRFVSKFGAAAP